ncbi:MAG: hypothetical protein LWX01_11780 [Deltaproteobacteria bacterium]|nr:hypothetical protein [Deltaproteobacteria bacterium]MDL1962350.1 hypothetical protein [Deltaproteobacteria bacterium]
MTQIEQREGHTPSFRANGLEMVALELRAIYEISQIVGSALYLDKALSQILHVLNATLHMKRATLVLLNETDRSLSIRASYGLTNIEEKCRKHFMASILIIDGKGSHLA